MKGRKKPKMKIENLCKNFFKNFFLKVDTLDEFKGWGG